LGALVPANTETRLGSAAAILRVMHEPPHLKTAEVDELDAAINAPSIQTIERLAYGRRWRPLRET